MPVYCPQNPYPFWWRVALFGRKNGQKAKPQGVRKGKRRTKPPHRGGKK